MIYKAIGIMSGSALDGLDIAYVHFLETGGKWSYELLQAETLPYSGAWAERLKNAIALSALDYQLLHADYGHYIGAEVNRFINIHGLQHKVDVIGSHGHTTFHMPARRMTGQVGDGAAIANTWKVISLCERFRTTYVATPRDCVEGAPCQ